MSAYVAYRSKKIQTPRKLIEEIDSLPEPPPKCPNGQFKMFLRVREANVNDNITKYSGVKVGTSPAMKTEGTKLVPVISNSLDNNKKLGELSVLSVGVQMTNTMSVPPLTSSQSPIMSLRKRIDGNTRLSSPGSHVAQFVQTSSGRQIFITPSSSGTTVVTPSGQRLTVVKSTLPQQQHQQLQQQRNGRSPITKPVMKVSPLITVSTSSSIVSSIQSSSVATVSTVPMAISTIKNPQLTTSLAQELKTHSYASATSTTNHQQSDDMDIDEDDHEFTIAEKEQLLKERRKQKLHFIAKLNKRKCDAVPMFGSDLRGTVINLFTTSSKAMTETKSWFGTSYLNCLAASDSNENWSLNKTIRSYEQRTNDLQQIFNNFVLFVPAVSAPMPWLHISHPHPSKLNADNECERVYAKEVSPKLTLLHPIISAMSTQFPDPRLIQYDCGKLQTLDRLLRTLKTNQHRVLIFTQMTRMLDVLEAFLNFHGHIYLRLDGSTRIEQRQILMDRFNNDKRIFVFILSTRSGGVGVNLTGADTVIFYDSDWNPTMDAQAQDRCHRIGQTRDVHIYRLVSEKTIEENILKKANQKRLLGDLAIEGGNFTTAYFKSTTIQDLFKVNNAEDNASARLSEVLERDRERRTRLQDNLILAPSTSAAIAPTPQPEDRAAIGALESALAAAEDEQDVQAAKVASAEADADLAEFDESIPIEDNDNNKAPEISKAEQEVENIVKQVSTHFVDKL